jgi:hypothetical protein
MSTAMLKSKSLDKILASIALLLMIAVFFMPVWWVSLKAPNYPQDTFPDGIRIHFAFTGVSNGCSNVHDPKKTEIYQGDLGDDPAAEREAPHAVTGGGLDCMHEMDTINHYVGMYPIATGSPVETKMAKYIFGVFAVMLLGFIVDERKKQLAILGVGFLAVSAWIGLELFMQGGAQSIVSAYQENLGHYFKDMDKIAAWAANLSVAIDVFAAVLIGTMVVLFLGALISPKVTAFFPLIPAMLPVFFIVDYAGWLWFFGHNLHPWGAFTLKPFMPTVFGEGKVAQFSTLSFPHFGFLVLVVLMVMLVLAFLLRRKAMRGGAQQ